MPQESVRFYTNTICLINGHGCFGSSQWKEMRYLLLSEFLFKILLGCETGVGWGEQKTKQNKIPWNKETGAHIFSSLVMTFETLLVHARSQEQSPVKILWSHLLGPSSIFIAAREKTHWWFHDSLPFLALPQSHYFTFYNLMRMDVGCLVTVSKLF